MERAVRLVLVTVLLVTGITFASYAQEKTTLVVMDWKVNETGGTQEWFQEVKERFESKFPNVEIEYVWASWGQAYLDRILVGAAGGVSPDVVSLSIIWARDLWDQGYLLDLTPYVEKTPELHPDQFIPVTQLYNQKDGRIYGITNAMDEALYVYDLDAFEEAGLDTDPDAIQTWSDFLEAAKVLTRTQGDQVVRYGLQMAIGIEQFNSWLVSNGGSFYNDDLTAPGFNKDPGTETADFLLELQQAGVLGGNIEEFTAAMGYRVNAAPYYIAQNAPNLRFNVASFPRGPSGTRRGTTVWGNMNSITKASEQPDLAWEFIKMYTSLEGSIGIFEKLDYVNSPRLDFYQSDAWLDALDRNIWFKEIPRIAMVGGVYPFLRYTELANEVWNPIMLPAIQGKTGIEGAFEEAERLYAGILEGVDD